MGVRTTDGERKVALFDSVTGFAFGPVLDDVEEADAFLEHIRRVDGRDARELSDGEIEVLFVGFRRERKVAA